MTDCSTPTIQQEPPYFSQKHDCSGKLHGPYRFLIQLPTGAQITAATVAAVDENNYPLPFAADDRDGDSIVISNVSSAVATDQITPNTWAVSFYVTNGSPKVYRIQCRYDLNTTPAVGDDLIMLLLAVK